MMTMTLGTVYLGDDRDQAGTCAASVENGQENGTRILGVLRMRQPSVSVRC